MFIDGIDIKTEFLQPNRTHIIIVCHIMLGLSIYSSVLRKKIKPVNLSYIKRKKILPTHCGLQPVIVTCSFADGTPEPPYVPSVEAHPLT